MISIISRRIDWQIIFPALVLIFLSLSTLWSVNLIYFRQQIIFVFLSALVFVFFSQVDLSFLKEFSMWIYIVCFLGFLLLLIIGIETRGAVRWLDFFGIQVQFSEIFKPFLLISLSAFLAEKTKSIKNMAISLVFLMPIAFLIIKQPDLGSGILYILAVLLTLVFVGFPMWIFVLGAISVAFISPVVFFFLKTYQKARILTFLHLTNDPLGTSYNAIQAIIATGSGGFFGKGFGQGTQSALRFLPERHTDFIFATLSEDLGFFGGLILILAFSYLLYRIYKIFLNSDNTFEKIFVSGAFSIFIIQFFVNIGMNIGLLPIVGIPLPLVSYGGSSLISSAILLGLVSGISLSHNKKTTLEIK